LVVEVDHVHGKPLVLVFTFGELYDFTQASSAQRRLGILAQLVTSVASLACPRAELIARALVSIDRIEVLVSLYTSVGMHFGVLHYKSSMIG
jgi:hypothetical protein